LLRDGLEKPRIKTKIDEGSLFLLLLLRRLFDLCLSRLLGGFRLFSLIALSLCGSHLGFEGVEMSWGDGGGIVDFSARPR
jgi:hypothetical protein